MPTLRVEVWSDIACPWCWVGKRNLEGALAAMDCDVEVRWRAFELNPKAARDVPPAVDYVERLAKKYRTTQAAAQAMIDRMVEVGRAAGLDFRFDRVRPTNTFDAHRLLHAAIAAGAQDALAERIFAAYMHEGRLVSDHAVLAELATDVGLDADWAQSILATDTHADAVRADEQTAGDLGITGVPFFLVAGRYGIGGAQPADVLRQVFERARGESTATKLTAAPASAAACDADGCPIE